MDRLRQFTKRVGFGAIRLAVAVAATAGITFLCFRLIAVNATTAGFCYLVEVLIIATVWGLREAVVTDLSPERARGLADWAAGAVATYAGAPASSSPVKRR